jgi:hypothetical protein
MPILTPPSLNERIALVKNALIARLITKLESNICTCIELCDNQRELIEVLVDIDCAAALLFLYQNGSPDSDVTDGGSPVL